MVRRAADELSAMTQINARNYRAHVELADLRTQLSQQSEAADALDRAMFIDPSDAEIHQRLADLSTELGQWNRAVRERQAVIALDPVDLAQALYQLARTYFQAGDNESARRTVIRALERAPNYEEAQDLLLEIHNKRTGSEGGWLELRSFCCYSRSRSRRLPMRRSGVGEVDRGSAGTGSSSTWRMTVGSPLCVSDSIKPALVGPVM